MKGCEIEGIYRTRPFTSNLDLAECDQITDDGLKYLVNMTNDLDLSGCCEITDEGLKYLVNMRSGLYLS